MAYRDDTGQLTNWLHRHGVSRRVNSTYSTEHGWRQCTVDTALPIRRLAMVANRRETPRLSRRERVDRWIWRWTFVA